MLYFSFISALILALVCLYLHTVVAGLKITVARMAIKLDKLQDTLATQTGHREGEI